MYRLVVVEKSKSTNTEAALRIMDEADSIAEREGLILGLVVFGGRGIPLVDISNNKTLKIGEAYSESPIIPGRPEPGLGLKEAYYMIMDSTEGVNSSIKDYKVILVWSMASRPKTPIDLFISLLDNMDIEVKIVALRPSIPKWFHSYSSYPENRIFKVRKNTNIARLASELLG
ncbi:MAG: hypothetical protein GSR85_05095 [Desulfurococcales archaeon]|nr:hypothetical protein [Desulfurococcales archaeon]